MPLTNFHEGCRCNEVWSVREQIDAKITAADLLICEIRSLKEAHPDLQIGYQLSPGGILNAYREGDIDFETAVHRIKELQPEMST